MWTSSLAPSPMMWTPSRSARLAMENQLQAAGGIAANLAARYFTIIRNAHFIRCALFRQLLFGFADERNFRNRINSVGIILRIRHHALIAKDACGGDATLLHGNRGQRGKPMTSPAAKIFGTLVR